MRGSAAATRYPEDISMPFHWPATARSLRRVRPSWIHCASRLDFTRMLARTRPRLGE